MISEPRAVFDTNVTVSAALLSSSVSRQALDRARASGRLLISNATFEELYDVLSRPRFDKYVAEEERIEFLTALIEAAEVIGVTEIIKQCRDPKDDKFLELAVNGQANVIVSGDKDLLVLNPFRGIPILTPRDFLAET
jgi:uncharacterized protein